MLFHRVKMGRIEVVLNRIPMTWSGAGVWREEGEGEGEGKGC